MVSQKVKLIAVVAIAIPVLVVSFVFIFSNPCPPGGPASVISGDRIIDHTCTDLSQIPAQYIEQIKATVKWHYAHRSHGEQLTIGLEQIESENATFSQAIADFFLPTEIGALCIMNGQPGYHGNVNESYVMPYDYWETEAGLNRTRDVLDNNPAINFTFWTWCDELEYYNEDQVQAYLDNLTTLEAEYPNVTFIYMTANAQKCGAIGYNRYLLNQQIRQYCLDKDKWLFDFADIDCWYNGQQSTYLYNDISIPVEHSQFHWPDGPGHTTLESCELKGAAVWWMFARILGWSRP